VFSYFHDRLLKTIQLLRNYDDVILLTDTDSNVDHSAITINIYAP
jgi:5S rRNA maturation endonuclease (ribonuclease M5)